jgi:hypothetical protein
MEWREFNFCLDFYPPNEKQVERSKETILSEQYKDREMDYQPY